MSEREGKIAELRWKKFPVLDQGFVCLVDVMGDDHQICDAARISYGAGTRMVSDDRGLIRYLMRNRHTSPFEMAELKFLVRVPMDAWRQWIRHRMASVNEYSTRYSEAIDAMQATPPDQWRKQTTSNKQGSSGRLDKWEDEYVLPKEILICEEDGMRANERTLAKGEPVRVSHYRTPGHYLSEREAQLHGLAREIYEKRLMLGVAREQARKDLPLSTYTEAYWKIDLHNLLHFLSLRMDAHAQKEIRDYATIIGREIVAPLFPIVWDAFEDYRLNAMSLSALDVRVIKALTGSARADETLAKIENARERDECRAKLVRLGFIPG